MNYPGDFQTPREKTALQLLFEALNANFPIGRFFGVHVRMYWISIVLFLFFLSGFGEWMSTGEAMTHAALHTVLLFVVIWSHEMGHIVMGWRFGIHTPLITLSPLGGLAHLSAPAPNPAADIKISLAGPATHLLWLAIFAPLWFFVFEPRPALFKPEAWAISPVGFAVELLVVGNFWLMCFNLLPFFPMDGGRTLRAFLGMRMHPNAATMVATQIGIVGAVLFMVGPFLFPEFLGASWILFMIGLSNMIACVQERRAARFGVGPWDATAQLEPWQTNPDAWQQGDAYHQEGKPGYLQRRREDKERKRREKARAERAKLESEVDRILEKVSDVGMSGLTEKEKRTLKQAADLRKDT